MRLVTTRTATRLTGLSTEQLREWSNRRALIPADVQRRGRGAAAQYGWQAILLLRIAVMLKDRFHLELHAHRGLFAALREMLAGVSFIGLWGCSIAIYDADEWRLLDASETDLPEADAIIIKLDPHLSVLAVELAMPSPTSSGQLDLFPARLVPTEGSEGRTVASAIAGVMDAQRKRGRA